MVVSASIVSILEVEVMLVVCTTIESTLTSIIQVISVRLV